MAADMQTTTNLEQRIQRLDALRKRSASTRGMPRRLACACTLESPNHNIIISLALQLTGSYYQGLQTWSSVSSVSMRCVSAQ